MTVGKFKHFPFLLKAMRIIVLTNIIRLVSLLFGEGGLELRSSSRERVEWTRTSRADGTRAARQGFVFQEKLKLVSVDSQLNCSLLLDIAAKVLWIRIFLSIIL